MKISFLILIFTILFILISFKTDYMDCSKILKKHLDMFKTDNNRIPFILNFTYVYLPFILGLILSIIKSVNKDIISVMTVIITILTSMLFTLLVMVIDLRKRYNEENNDSAVASEVYYSIMFEIFISVLILISLMMYMFSFKEFNSEFFDFNKLFSDLKSLDYLAGLGFSIIIYGLNFLLLFNLFIILKRVFTLVEKSISKK